MAVEASTAPFRFLSLPAEIREHIYTYLFDPKLLRRVNDEDYATYKYNFALFLVNKQVHFESRKVFRRLNIFACIETPWEEAEHHVSVDGHVPILIQDELAESFHDYTVLVEIETREPIRPERRNSKFVILLEDLELFTRMWYYSDLSYGGRLNPNLRLTLRIRDPDAKSYEDAHVPKAIQARIIEPFGLVKSLAHFEVVGHHYPSLVDKVRQAMAMPYDPPEKCLEEATKLKDEGNQALSKKAPRLAIALYVKAFEKIHIICVGHLRSIWADAWFDRQFSEGPFKDQHGQVVRLILRVSLVANIVKAYLDLQEYDEAEFWGMRSIGLVREAMGLGLNDERDEPLLNFPASNQVGKIYYHTAVACKALAKTEDARKLLRVAVLYLPQDENVKRELASVSHGLRLI